MSVRGSRKRILESSVNWFLFSVWTQLHTWVRCHTYLRVSIRIFFGNVLFINNNNSHWGHVLWRWNSTWKWSLAMIDQNRNIQKIWERSQQPCIYCREFLTEECFSSSPIWPDFKIWKWPILGAKSLLAAFFGWSKSPSWQPSNQTFSWFLNQVKILEKIVKFQAK